MVVHFFNVARHFSQNRLLDATLYHSGLFRISVVHQVGGNDGRADLLGGIDDLFDARDSKSDM